MSTGGNDLVSGVLTRISELEAAAKRALEAGAEPRWQVVDRRVLEISPAFNGLIETPCGPVADLLAAHDPHAVLRLCRAHRQIVEQYQEAVKLAASRNHKRAHGVLVMEAEAAEQALLDVVAALAVGLGVVEEDRNGE